MPEAKHIFIVDDDQGLVRLIEKALKRESFKVSSATSGKQAVFWLSRNAADLLLLDLGLADMGGDELVQSLASLGRSIPFVIITGQGDERVAVQMMKKGALDYIVKDSHFIDALPSQVHRAMAQLEREKNLQAAEEALRRSQGNLAKAQQMAHFGSYEAFVKNIGDNYWSTETYRILGLRPGDGPLPPEEFVRRVVYPDDRSRVAGALKATIENGELFDVEFRIQRSDRTIRHVHSLAEPVKNDAGEVFKLVGTILDITDRKRLETEVLAISEREQRRIGHDLHDGLCQHLTGIELMSQVLHHRLGALNLREAENAAKLSRLVREAIAQTRALARGLSPVVKAPEGLMDALHELAQNTRQLFNIPCSFECSHPVLVSDFEAAEHLYRIAQEAVGNALKHSKCKSIIIALSELPERIMIAVHDDGIGLPPKASKDSGMGLRVMQYRAGMINASLAIQKGARGGTSVLCTISRKTHEEANTSSSVPKEG